MRNYWLIEKELREKAIIGVLLAAMSFIILLSFHLTVKVGSSHSLYNTLLEANLFWLALLFPIIIGATLFNAQEKKLGANFLFQQPISWWQFFLSKLLIGLFFLFLLLFWHALLLGWVFPWQRFDKFLPSLPLILSLSLFLFALSMTLSLAIRRELEAVMVCMAVGIVSAAFLVTMGLFFHRDFLHEGWRGLLLGLLLLAWAALLFRLQSFDELNWAQRWLLIVGGIFLGCLLVEFPLKEYLFIYGLI